MAWLGFQRRVSQVEINVSDGLYPFLEAVGKNLLLAHSGYWLNSVPYCYRTEVPVSLLAVSWGLLSFGDCSQLLEAIFIPCLVTPTVFKSGNGESLSSGRTF